MADDLFSVISEQRGHALHLHLSGELDMATSPILEGWLSGAEQNGNTAIVVDLENITFMNASCGIRALVRASDRASRNGRTFEVVNAPSVVLRLLRITRATHLLATDPPSVSPTSDRQMINENSGPP